MFPATASKNCSHLRALCIGALSLLAEVSLVGLVVALRATVADVGWGDAGVVVFAEVPPGQGVAALGVLDGLTDLWKKMEKG